MHIDVNANHRTPIKEKSIRYSEDTSYVPALPKYYLRVMTMPMREGS